MNIRLHRIHSTLPIKKEVIKEDNELLNEINEHLENDDLFITEDADVDDMDIVFVETGGSEEAFKKIFNILKAPIVLLSSSKNNSLASCFEIRSYALKNKKQALIALGEIEEITNVIRHLAKIFKAKHEIHGSRLGVIGKPSDWLIYSQVDYSEVGRKYGIGLIDIPMEEFFEEIELKKHSRVRHLEDIKKKAKNEKTLEMALNIYGALKRLIIRYNLDGLTVRCFDLLDKYKNTSCLALALLNEEGYVATCEGDIPAMLTMFMLNKINGFSTFQANPSYIFFQKRQVLFAHCTVPFDMVSSYELDTHFESGLGIGIRGQLNTGRCTIYKISSDLKHYLAIDGNIVKNENRKEYCRTQILVELQPNDLIEFIEGEFGNHVIISYEDNTADFMSLMSLYEEDKD